MIMLLAALLVPGDSLHSARLPTSGPPGTAEAVGLHMKADPLSLPESPFTPRVMPDAFSTVTTHPRPLSGGLWTPRPLSLPSTVWAKGIPGPGAPEPEPQIIEYSDAYLTRLKIHKYASYATLPLFVGAYVTGNELITKGENAASWARNTHGVFAGSLGVLFAVNTITGVWNLYEGRHDPEGRGRRILHSVLLLAADAGFLATAAMAGESEGGEGGGDYGEGGGDNSAHRAMAITSMGLAFAGYMTMSWPFRRD